MFCLYDHSFVMFSLSPHSSLQNNRRSFKFERIKVALFHLLYIKTKSCMCQIDDEMMFPFNCLHFKITICFLAFTHLHPI